MEYKGYLIKPSKMMPTLYIVTTAGQGGKIPSVLEGFFTSTGLVKLLIDNYVESKPKKEPKNGETRTESGD